MAAKSGGSDSGNRNKMMLIAVVVLLAAAGGLAYLRSGSDPDSQYRDQIAQQQAAQPAAEVQPSAEDGVDVPKREGKGDTTAVENTENTAAAPPDEIPVTKQKARRSASFDPGAGS